MNKRYKVEIPTGYVRVPSDWVRIQVLEDESEADCICVVETMNGNKLGIPHFVFPYCNYEGITDEEQEKIYAKIAEIEPNFQKKVLNCRVKLVKNNQGRIVNVEEWMQAPLPGIFKIKSLNDTEPYAYWPYNVIFYSYDKADEEIRTE